MAANARQVLKLYVGNLSWTVGHTELRQYFSKFGHVATASVVFDKNTGISRNYGFVQFSNKDAYQSASNSSHHLLEGQKLVVQPAQ